MIYCGLLSDRQKRLGYYCMQDYEEIPQFIYIFKAEGKGKTDCVGIFSYYQATIKEIRDFVNEHINGQRE